MSEDPENVACDYAPTCANYEDDGYLCSFGGKCSNYESTLVKWECKSCKDSVQDCIFKTLEEVTPRNCPLDGRTSDWERA